MPVVNKVYFHAEINRVNKVPKRNIKRKHGGFPGGTVVKNPPANAGDTGLSPGPGRSHMLRSS